MAAAQNRIVATLLALLATSGVVGAQGQEAPLSATLLARLSAAAHDYRTGEPVYVVAAVQFPHELVGVFPRRAQADSAAGVAGPGYEVFGPFVTPMDFGLPVVVLGPGKGGLGHCVGSPMMCRPTEATALPDPPWLARDVDSVGVVIYHRSGETWRSVSHGLSIDAMFLTLAAFDKFALPYYTMLQGPERAAALRDSIAEYVRRAGR